MRRVARENLFKLVFEYTFYGTANDQTLELMLQGSDLTEDDKNFINGCYCGIVTREDELKKIIEDHGGYIWATSRENEGTCLHFVIRKYREVEDNE